MINTSNKLYIRKNEQWIWHLDKHLDNMHFIRLVAKGNK